MNAWSDIYFVSALHDLYLILLLFDSNAREKREIK